MRGSIIFCIGGLKLCFNLLLFRQRIFSVDCNIPVSRIGFRGFLLSCSILRLRGSPPVCCEASSTFAVAA